MCGWDSRAAARASRCTRPRRSGSVASFGASSFTATGRPSTSSYPRHTTDIPPAPSRSTSRYRPASVSTTPFSVPYPDNSTVTPRPRCRSRPRAQGVNARDAGHTQDVETLAGRYRPIQQIGTGGMSVVWHARDEVLDGPSLADELRTGPLPWPRALPVCADVAAGLGAAHAAGLVHRDVKPGNVMLGSTGAKLVDFGISAEIGESYDPAPDGSVLGTPAYVAPERLTSGPALAASDVYGLGLLLYRTLTGRLPWDVESRGQLLHAT